jgi:hypothetical protein
MKQKYILSEDIFYSPVRQQWLVAFNQNGTMAGLIPKAWHSAKVDALIDLKSSLDFRLGLVADCTILYKRLDKINKEIERLSK